MFETKPQRGSIYKSTHILLLTFSMITDNDDGYYGKIRVIIGKTQQLNIYTFQKKILDFLRKNKSQ